LVLALRRRGLAVPVRVHICLGIWRGARVTLDGWLPKGRRHGAALLF